MQPETKIERPTNTVAPASVTQPEEEKRDPHLTYPSPPPEGFDESGALVDKARNEAALKARAEILSPTKDRPSFEQIEAERAREQGEAVPTATPVAPGTASSTVAPASNSK